MCRYSTFQSVCQSLKQVTGSCLPVRVRAERELRMEHGMERKPGWIKETAALLFALLFFCGLMPGSETGARAAWDEVITDQPVEYRAKSWTGASVQTYYRICNSYTRLADRAENTAPQGGENRFSLFDGNTFKDHQPVNFFYADRDQTFEKRCIVQGDVHLILKDGVTITCKDGIWVPQGSSLSIYGQEKGTGKLIAMAETNYVAAIGGNDGQSGGTIVVHGGEVIADAHNNGRGTDAAGIGGGNWGSGGSFTIYDGKVTARGANYGAGIGSGDADGEGVRGGTVMIYGGEVKAYGGYDSAGIGGGEGGSGANVLVCGGSVYAEGGWNKKDDRGAPIYVTDGGAGIGSGDDDGRNISAGTFEIRGGQVEAVGASRGAGIGGGDGCSGGKITISGGSVTARGGLQAAGIGGGYYGNGGNISITGGAVMAFGSRADYNYYRGRTTFYGGAGIGGGAYGHGGTINISGGNVIGHGGRGGAGIGGGQGAASGNITITGGDIQCSGKPAGTYFDEYTNTGGAGIGSGYNYTGSSDPNTIRIHGGLIRSARGGFGGAGIGWGAYNSYPGTIDIKADAQLEWIEGGSLNLEGGAGIGGGYNTSGGTITIENVSAFRVQGAFHGAGIGGGSYGSGGNISITGGQLRVYAGQDGAGIGGGSGGDGGTVELTNTNITVGAEDYSGAGIGGGKGGNGGNVHIFGSWVTVYGSKAIGRGQGGNNDGGVAITEPVTIRDRSGNKINNESSEIFGQNYLRIEPACSVTYDANGAIGNEPRDSGVYLVSQYFTVLSASNLDKPGHTFKSWNSKADGSGQSYIPGQSYPIPGNLTLYAIWELLPVPYLDWNGSELVEKSGDQACGNYELVDNNTRELKSGKWYVVAWDVAVSSRMDVEGTVHLIIQDGKELKVSGGIIVSPGEHLILYGQSGMSGKVTTVGGSDNAGIGGARFHSGDVTVNGCNITATGGEDAAGIGGGYEGNAGSLTVNGGTVTANGGKRAAGIGGGQDGKGGTVTVNGGMVTATGGDQGAGIGGGYDDYGGTVTVNGGTVRATGGTGATGIGAGKMNIAAPNHGDIFAATTHVAYSSENAITDLNKQSQNPVKGKGTVQTITIPRYRYMLVEPESPENTHSFTYSANGDYEKTITARCSNYNCTLPHKRVTLTLVAPPTTAYDPNQAAPTVELDGLAAFNAATGKNITEGDIKYWEGSSQLPGAPKKAGSYHAELKLENVKKDDGTNGYVMATAYYGILKAVPTATLPVGTATYGQKLGEIPLTNPTGNTPGRWVWEDSPDTSVGNVGFNSFKATFIPNDAENYKALSGMDVPVYVLPGENPATVIDTAYVMVGGNTVDLRENVHLNGIQAAVTFGFPYGSDPLGCTLDESGVLTSGNQTGEVQVSVSIAGDPGHNPTPTTTITVHITPKDQQFIIADDVTTTFGATDARVSAVSTGGGTISYAVKDGSGDRIDIDASTGALTIKKAGTAYVVVTAAETQTYQMATKDVKVTIGKAQNPAKVSDAAYVKQSSPGYPSTYDLSRNVILNRRQGDTTGYTIIYEFFGDEHGCSLVGSTLTAGTDSAQVTVNVSIDEPDDSNYFDLPPTPILVTINANPIHTIITQDVTTTYGATGVSVHAETYQVTAITYAVDPGSEELIDIDSSSGALTIKKAGTAFVVVRAAASADYAEAYKYVTVTINKARPNVSAPAGLTATYGQTLADVLLPDPGAGETAGRWDWADRTTSVGPAGTRFFRARFTPEDTTNYQTLENVNVPVTVVKEKNPANVFPLAGVLQGGNTIDLMENVMLNGAAGAVSFRIEGDALGCSLTSEGKFTSGSEMGIVTVRVRIEEDEHYEALDDWLIVLVVGYERQTIEAKDVTVVYGHTKDPRIIARVTEPETGGGAISFSVLPGYEKYLDVAADGRLTIKAIPPTDGKAYVYVKAEAVPYYSEGSAVVVVTVVEKAEYRIASVLGGTHMIGSGENAVITVTREPRNELAFEKFLGVSVDGKELEREKDYTARSGSVVLELKSDWLDTLSEGNHPVHISFIDGEADLIIQTLRAVPKTGDSAHPGLWIGLVLLGLIGILASSARKGIRKHEK